MDLSVNYREASGPVYYADAEPTPAMLLNNAVVRYGFLPRTPACVVADRLEDDGRPAEAAAVRSLWRGDS